MTERFHLADEMIVTMTPIDELTRHPDNANQGDVDAIRESIATNGYYQPVIAQASTGYILAGNHRWEASLQMGAASIPVIYLDVDDEQAKRIMVADNRTTRLGRDDPTDLLRLLDELSEADRGLMGTGYSAADHRQLIEDLGRPLEFDEDLDQDRDGLAGAKKELAPLAALPIIDRDGLCVAVRVTREDGEAISRQEYAGIRQKLGLDPFSPAVLDGFGIEGWS